MLNAHPYNSWLGFNFLTPPNDFDDDLLYLESSAIPMETFYYGLYKINASIWNTDSDIIEKKGEFYMDFRDANYPGYVPPLPVIGGGTDFWIKYEGNTQPYFFYRATAPAQNDNNHNSLFEELFEDLWTLISSSEVIPIWKFKLSTNDYVPSTVSFQNFWQNCLVLIPSATGSKPRLVWGAHPTITVENYVIYRAVSSTPLSNPESSANLIATVSSSTFEYTDNSILLGPVDYVYYFVKGKYRQGYLLTSRTNIVDTRGGLYKENTNEEINIPDKLEITNFPNPFNPTTTINYAIPENGFTELKVYNIYGELVEILVSGNKEAGSYSVRFPSSGGCLASGVYLYTLTSGR